MGACVSRRPHPVMRFCRAASKIRLAGAVVAAVMAACFPRAARAFSVPAASFGGLVRGATFSHGRLGLAPVAGGRRGAAWLLVGEGLQNAAGMQNGGARGLKASSGLHRDKVLEIEEQLLADDPIKIAGDEEVKVNLLSLSPEALEKQLVEWGAKKFVAKQIHQWLYDKGATSIDQFTNVSKEMRELLKSRATMGTLEIATEQVSKDGTIKRAYKLPDGQLIESVLMPYEDGRRTACISSQAGCAMGCVFCATGQMGFARQLTASEIFEQVQRFHSELAQKGERLSNVVLMGMGEPLGNYKNVLSAVRRMNTEIGIGARHITISTVGLVPRIQRLAKEGLQVKLAVSLHAANDKERSEIMPVNVRFPLRDLMQTCRDYVRDTGRRITFEWALIAGQNDTPETAHELGQLLQGLMCHVNLIPLNPTE